MPEIEETVKFHFTMTLGKIKDISLQLVKAQFNYQGGMADQRHHRMRKLQQKMYQCEHFE